MKEGPRLTHLPLDEYDQLLVGPADPQVSQTPTKPRSDQHAGQDGEDESNGHVTRMPLDSLSVPHPGLWFVFLMIGLYVVFDVYTRRPTPLLFGMGA